MLFFTSCLLWNFIQVAQILQVLVHSKWQAFDPKQSDLYSRFDKDCVSSILDTILDEGPGTTTITFSSSSASSSAESSPSVDSCIDAHRLLLGLNRTVALVAEKGLNPSVMQEGPGVRRDFWKLIGERNENEKIG